MEMQENSVNISYSAEEKKELDSICAKYQTPVNSEPTNLEKIKKMDARVERSALFFALSIGIIGTLILGTGMTCVLVWNLLAPGILIGLIGLAGIIFAWPLYQKALRKAREKAAPEILQLSKAI